MTEENPEPIETPGVALPLQQGIEAVHEFEPSSRPLVFHEPQAVFKRLDVEDLKEFLNQGRESEPH